MFDRFIRLQQARKALREGRFEDVLALASDPLVGADRRAEQLRLRARDALVERGRQRLLAGDLSAARAIHERLRGTCDGEAVRALGREIETGQEAARTVADALREALGAAGELLAVGDPSGAERALGDRGFGLAHASKELTVIRERIIQQRRRAEEEVVAAGELLARGESTSARMAFARGLALDRPAAERASVRPRLRSVLVREAARAVGQALAADDLEGALQQLKALRADCRGVGSGSEDDMPDALPGWPGGAIEKALADALRADGDLERAVALARSARAAGLQPTGGTGELLAVLVRLGQADRAPDAELARSLCRAAKAAGAHGLAAAARRLERQQDAFGLRLENARQRTAEGDLDGAREELIGIIAEDPMHEAARRELELVEQGLADLGERLHSARAAAKAGRLREACATALAVGGSGRLGADAQLLLTDLRARMALVDRGLSEVLATLHGRGAGSVQGVQHCLSRLEELAKVQSDHAELAAVVEAVRAEVRGLHAAERAQAAFAGLRHAEARAALDEVLQLRGAMLTPERLDARLSDLGDQLGRRAEEAATRGDGKAVAPVLESLQALAVVDASFGAAAERVRGLVGERQAEAERRADEARQALARRDLAEAERLHEQAEAAWRDATVVRTLGEELQALRRQTTEIERVAEMTGERDYRGAAARVAQMPPTPPLLRTRIFDMKQQLARAQGLEGAFLLRVDEGGEYLVMRGESISIGNMRQRTADLPILANLAGRHATIRRSMSFHGGMEDTIRAEGGELLVAGRPVKEHRLAPGDRFQLGSSLVAIYERPTSRSLTVGLTLQGGFQVAGTERVLLMKDRGKDGRILLGPSRDAHVRVPSAGGEVAVFSAPNGQIRVACAQGGKIDGVPFRGEHPVDAGQVVEAGGITFVLLPWRPV